MKRVLRGASALAAVVLAGTMQYLLVAVPSIEPRQFSRSAVELQRSGGWRYGYVRQYHGAVLVKARREVGEAAFVAPDPGNRIASLMLRELRSRMWKAAFELLFYAALFGLWKAGWPRFLRALEADRSRVRWSVSAGFGGALFVSAVIAPFLVAGYGEPLFSTLAGPGARSSSALLPRTTATFNPCVSYGIVLESVVLIWPLMAAQVLNLADALDTLTSVAGLRGVLWMLTALFWGVAATAVAWLGLTPGPRPAHPTTFDR